MLEDIHLIYFERVKMGKTIDVVFIVKETESDNIGGLIDLHIGLVPANVFEDLQKWAATKNVECLSGPTNLDWYEILDHRNKDVKQFQKRGGWGGLFDESGESEEEPVPVKTQTVKPKQAKQQATKPLSENPPPSNIDPLLALWGCDDSEDESDFTPVDESDDDMELQNGEEDC